MQELGAAWSAIKFGGAMVYPLLFLGVLAVAIIIDRSVLYARCLRLPAALADLVETFGFSWVELEKQLKEPEIVDLLEFLTHKGKYLPLPLDRIATVVSTNGTSTTAAAPVSATR